MLKYVIALGLYHFSAPQCLHDKRKVIEQNTKSTENRYQGQMHGVLLCVASTGAHSFMLLWVASLANLLKFCAGVLGVRRRAIYNSPFINTLELAEPLPQERVAQHIVRDVCSLLLDLKPNKRRSDGTEAKQTSSVTQFTTANNKNGEPTTLLILTALGTFLIKQGYHIRSELTSRSAKTLPD